MSRIQLTVVTLLVWATCASAADLPSWHEGDTKTAILDFVAAVTDSTSPDFVAVPQRIAVFDNDGTSWCERPGYVPTAFQVGLLRSKVAAGEVDGSEMPFRAWLADDRKALRKFGWGDAYVAMNATFAGMPTAAYRDSARAFLARERHEAYGLRHTQLYYTPMRELKDLLEAHDFKVWIVTGAAQEFVRAYIEPVFGIPPERVIGSWTPPVYGHEEDVVTMVRGAEQVYNGHQNKPAHIELRIGRRPIFAVGNSNNDESMCRWTVSGDKRALALWIHHDDDAREYDYDRGTNRIKGLTRDHGHAFEVSMKRDWVRIFDHE